MYVLMYVCIYLSVYGNSEKKEHPQNEWVCSHGLGDFCEVDRTGYFAMGQNCSFQTEKLNNASCTIQYYQRQHYIHIT